MARKAAKKSGADVTILSKKGKQKAIASWSAPLPVDIRPGDVVFDSLNGGKPQYYMVVQQWCLWAISYWRRTASVVPLSDKDMQNLPAARRTNLKAYGWD